MNRATGAIRPTPKIGQRVRAVNFSGGSIDDNLTVPPGTEGVVTYIDAMGTIFVSWDNGAMLGLLPKQDRWIDL